jgi:proteasome-associated ATPase
MPMEPARLMDANDQSALAQLVAHGEEALSLEDRLTLAQAFRGRSRERHSLLDHFLITEVIERTRGLLRAQEHQAKLRATVDHLLAPPWHPALVVRLLTAPGSAPRVLVAHGGEQRVVNIAEEVDAATLAPGDAVFLSHERNVIVGRAPDRIPPCGETALFERYTSDGRVVLKWRDETVVARAAAALGEIVLKPGDQVRWDRAMLFAFERVERADGGHLFLEETPRQSFAEIGGLHGQIERLKRSIGLQLFHPEVARKYRQRRRGSALLVGMPGTGKTLMARAFCNWLASQSRSGRARFMNIKPAGLHSAWYAQSEANYREAFRVAREAGAAEPEVPVVMFFDEVDAIGAARGQWGTRIDDRVQTALMAELDGLEARGNVLVLAATNRRSAIDPALLRPGRLGDLVIEIPRPNMAGARDIFAKYLPADIPYTAPAGDTGRDARDRVLDGIVASLYAPNGESTVATIRFRDGKQRAVRVADVISGADINQITASAIDRACLREIEIGDCGLRVEDLIVAAAEQMEATARALSPATCRQFIGNLADDMEVVAVEPVARKVAHPQHYLNAA